MSRQFKWAPEPDITVWELAQIMKTFLIKIDRKTLDSLPENVKRHIKEIKEETKE